MTPKPHSELEPAALVELIDAVGQWLGAESAPYDVIRTQERISEMAKRLEEQLEAAQSIDRSTWREGMVTVYDYEGGYVGCMGRESWDWLLEQGYEKCRDAVEQKEAADRVLAVADQLAEWCRVSTSVEGVFSNNLGAQAQAQGMANLVIRYAAARESYPASTPDAPKVGTDA